MKKKIRDIYTFKPMLNTYDRTLWGESGETPPSNASNKSPYTVFGGAIQQMLKDYQRTGQAINTKMMSAGLGVQAEGAGKGYEALPSNVAGMQLSPSQIQQYRGAQQSPYQAAMQGIGGMERSFSEQIKGLGSALERAQAIGDRMYQIEQDELARQDKKRQEEINLALTEPEGYLNYLNNLGDLKAKEKKLQDLGISEEVLRSLANKQTDLDTQITDIGDRRVLVNTQTGETIKDLGPTPLSAAEKKSIAEKLAEGEPDPMQMHMLMNVNTLLNDPSLLKSVSGKLRGANIFNRGAIAIRNQIAEQLKTQARSYIKGQGQISDAETEMLAKSATILSTTALSYEAMEQELRRIRGVIQANSGMLVAITTKKDGEIVDENILLDREQIYDATKKGYEIIFE